MPLAGAAARVSQDDLAKIAGLAIEKWRQQRPGADDPDDRFPDRGLQLGKAFGGAAAPRGDLTPECAEEVRAMLEVLGKRAGPEGRPDRAATAPRRPAARLPVAAPR
jgi:hypothetical protein